MMRRLGSARLVGSKRRHERLVLLRIGAPGGGVWLAAGAGAAIRKGSMSLHDTCFLSLLRLTDAAMSVCANRMALPQIWQRPANAGTPTLTVHSLYFHRPTVPRISMVFMTSSLAVVTAKHRRIGTTEGGQLSNRRSVLPPALCGFGRKPLNAKGVYEKSTAYGQCPVPARICLLTYRTLWR
jgi:hypothetical protein